MYTLGISCYYHDSAAAILKDGIVIAAIEEERFSRKKFDDGFPKLAIDWCLKHAKLLPNQLNSVAFYDKPVLKFERLLDNYIAVAPRGLSSFLDIIPRGIGLVFVLSILLSISSSNHILIAADEPAPKVTASKT